jgi:hypothetical protein
MDRTGRDLVLPGGVLNMVWHLRDEADPWHLRDEADPWHLLTRAGDDRPAVFLEFLARHGIAYSAASIVGRGASASVDSEIQPDLQPHTDSFVEGVWAAYRSTAGDEPRG